MVNTRRSKIRKTQNQNTPKTCLSVVENSDQKSSQSGSLIGSNDDLLTEILIRLPVTSILRFKSVSKHWLSLLTHRHFTQRYDINNLSKSPGLFAGDIYVPYDVQNPSAPPFRTLVFYPDPLGITIVQSCNGLLLCSSHRGSLDSRKYFVFNPTTKQFAVIPSFHGGLKARRSILHMGLAFHQTDCVHYKLVCIRTLKAAKDLLQVQIYSSDTGKWKICPVTFHSSWLFFQQQGVYWNGAFYWAPSYHNHLYFKIEDEHLQTLPLPLEMAASTSSRTMYFGESRGHLHLIVHDYPKTSLKTLNVYEMLSDHSGWFVKYQVDLPELWAAFPEMTVSPYDFKVVDVVRGEKEDDTFMVLIIPRIFIRYNVHDKSFKQIHDITNRYYAFVIVHRYTTTLGYF
ncbi:putative F-box domain-containing protein [Helianthus annuus]|nr:putative F-box domain-containing protein [Helianthus annuus]